MLRHLLLLLLFIAVAPAKATVYVLLWFDTEDYIEPASDDAALRIANDLSAMGVRATFKVVGEKARVLEARGRRDIFHALTPHDIGYHTDWHSVPPAPAVYLRALGWLEGAAEFERRERQGIADITRIFGIAPSCYGQPGSSWAPQALRALKRMGIDTYVDEGSQIGVNEQPFWLDGVLNVFNMGQYSLRASLDIGARISDDIARFDAAVKKLSAQGGGVISIYYHPTEFVTTEFWDGVNFPGGRMTEPEQWKSPQRRSAEDSERCFNILKQYVEYARTRPEVQFLTARELRRIFDGLRPPALDRSIAARHMAEHITFLVTGNGSYSAADLLQILLGLEPRDVEGPSERGQTNFEGAMIPRSAFERAKKDAISAIETLNRLPANLWLGSQQLSLIDFAATLASDSGAPAGVALRRGKPEMEQYVARNPTAPFRWPIHPEGFTAPELLDLARLQAWTLKPARLR
ncbi:MAG: hypothetical protein HUU41_12495 [Bryobacteraceae bacterium]|nr:hypothetical protein [Bryobacterales bacterium]MEB2363668.1 hypothetical protein [Bryobacterales bacterium]NUN01927.1 hypothetical protein [Bryobacteraceae bacterium]